MNDYDIGDTIRRARRRRGMSQQELAEIAGVGRRTVSLIETGATSPKIDTLAQILPHLGLSLLVEPLD